MQTPDRLGPIAHRPFTLAEAREFGLDYREVLREDVRRLSRELYVSGVAVPSIDERVRAHLQLAPDSWASHSTAAALHGLWLPESASENSLLHLSRPSTTNRVRRVGVAGHHVTVVHGEVEARVDGIRVTTPARTWLDLGQSLGHGALVALGDQIIRIPRPESEGRDQPYATMAQLVAMLRAHPRMRGVGRCKEALCDMRIGADSPPETLLRICLLAYNFPEPELQIRLHEHLPESFSADLGYRAWKIVVQYDGAHHLADEQRLHDLRRDAAFRAAGWIVIIATAEDLKNDFARVRHELRRHISGLAA